MPAFYNDNDEFAASWLQELIAHGVIPKGQVDRRSIVDLAPADVAGPGQRHFFAGIGGWPCALRLAGLPDDADIWTGSCPCQGLSDAGERRGFLDPRHLWPAWFPLIEQCRPPVLFGEQVASTLGLEWLDLVFADLERCGYTVGAADLCAAGVGAPHARQRLWFVAHAPGERLEGLRLQLQQRRSRATGTEVERGGEDSGLAHAAGERRDSESRHVPSRAEQPDADHQPAGAVGDMANGTRKRRGQGRETPGQNGPRSPDHGAYSQLADPDGSRLEVGGQQQARRQRSTSQRGGEARDLGNTSRPGSGRNPAGVPGEKAGRPSGWDGDRRVLDLPVPPGATRGFWAEAEWILCRDPGEGPPAARPVEPGAFPLAHGVPGRVGLLRGYGNAIVPEVACEFVLAALEAAGL